MTANSYDQAAQAQFINTYVPINFGELYRVGAAQRQVVEDAAQQFGAQLQKFGEFQSPSQLDTSRYYNLTTGRQDFQDAINQMVSNPDSMKDAGFRSNLQSLINSVDYATLSNLRQSVEGMKERQKVNQQLMLNNKFDSRWHDVNFTDYDTVSQGIFNDVSPLAYKSEVDLVKPYVDNLKPEFMGTKNGWITRGVSNQRVDTAVTEGLSSIQNTPEYKKHLEVLQRTRGLNETDARNELNRSLIVAAREFAVQDKERDPWWMKSQELQMRLTAKGKQPLNNLTKVLHNDARRNMILKFSGLATDAVNRYMLNGATGLSDQELATYNSNMTAGKMQNQLRQGKMDITKRYSSVRAGNNYVLDYLSQPISPETAEAYTKDGTDLAQVGKGMFSASNSRKFMLGSRFADAVTNTSSKTNRLADDWENGSVFSSFIIKGTTDTTTDGNRLFHRKMAFVPAEYIEGKYSAKEIADAGMYPVESSIIKDNLSTSISSDMPDVTKTTKSLQMSKGYYVMPVLTPISDKGEVAISQDASWDDRRNITQKLTDTQNELSELENYYYGE